MFFYFLKIKPVAISKVKKLEPLLLIDFKYSLDLNTCLNSVLSLLPNALILLCFLANLSKDLVAKYHSHFAWCSLISLARISSISFSFWAFSLNS